MFPTLFDSSWIGLTGALHFTIPTYFVAIVVGFLGAATLAYKDAMKMGIDRQKFIDFAIWMIIMGVLGSRLLSVLADGFFFDYVHLVTNPFLLVGRALPTHAPCIANTQCLAAQHAGNDIGGICQVSSGLCYPQRDYFRWLKFWAGGLTIYGGLFACATFAYFYIRKHKMGLARVMDLGGYGIFFGLFVGRLGCLSAGCCFGQVCHIGWLGVHFPVGSLAYQHEFQHNYVQLAAQWSQGVHSSLPVYPTELISSIYALIIFLVGYFVVRPRKRYHGQVILVTVLMYAVCRFLVEFIRADARGGMLGLSTSQLIGIPVILVTSYLLWRNHRRVRDA